MPRIQIVVPHTHGQETAAQRLLGFMAEMKQQHQDKVSDLKENWSDNRLDYSFRTFGLTVRGAVEVHPAEVALHADLPLAAALFKGKIEQEIRASLEKVLG